MENLKINLEEYYFVWVQPICKKRVYKKKQQRSIFIILNMSQPKC